jgi:hypothetical protein
MAKITNEDGQPITDEADEVITDLFSQGPDGSITPIGD